MKEVYMSSRRQINSEELSFFYQKIGEAIWQLQYVEIFLTQLYFIKAIAKCPDTVREEDVFVHMLELEKKTLGQLIGLIESKNIATKAFIDKLKDFNNKRKWVVHNSNREHGKMLYTEDGRSYFIQEIHKFINFAIDIQKEIEQDLLQYTQNFDIDVEEIKNNATKIIDDLKGIKSS